MARRPPYRHDEAHFFSVLEQLFQGEDRVAAIVGGALVDDTLEQLLTFHFPDNSHAQKLAGEFFEPEGGPFSSLKVKTDLCFVLGLVGPTARHNLDLVRKIRNTFAHNMLMPDAKELMSRVSFNTQAIASQCRELKLVELPGRPPVTDPRQRFVMACIFISWVLFDYMGKHSKTVSGQPIIS